MRAGTGALWAVLPIVLLAAAIAAGASSGKRAEAQEAPQAIAERFLSAVNAGDIDGAVATLANDVRVVSPDCLAVFGAVGCRSAAEFEMVLRAPPNAGLNVNTLSATTAGPSVTYRAEFRGAFIPPGFDRVLTSLRFTIAGGVISEIALDVDPTDPETANVLQVLSAPIAPPSTGDGGLVSPSPITDPAASSLLASLVVALQMIGAAVAARLVICFRAQQ
jgi:hypothetical protein